MAESTKKSAMGWGVRMQLFLRRTVAWLVDSVLINGAGWGLTLGLLFGVHLLKRAKGGPAMDFEFFVAELNGMVLQGINLAVTLMIAIGIEVVGLVRTGTTPGKWLLWLEVRDSSAGGFLSRGQAWRRFFYSGLSYLPFLAGYLMVPFQRQGLALHDILAGTRVVSRSKS